MTLLPHHITTGAGRASSACAGRVIDDPPPARGGMKMCVDGREPAAPAPLEEGGVVQRAEFHRIDDPEATQHRRSALLELDDGAVLDEEALRLERAAKGGRFPERAVKRFAQLRRFVQGLR